MGNPEKLATYQEKQNQKHNTKVCIQVTAFLFLSACNEIKGL
jgi:hypothetical protein